MRNPSTAIDTLISEHRRIERVIDALEAFAHSKETGAAADADAESFVAFFRQFADFLHHSKEEKILFELMHANGFPRDSGPTAVMMFEHEQGRKLVESMMDPSQRCEAIAQFAELLRAHIGKEDGILYPMATRRLSDAAFAELDRRCAAFDEQNKPLREELVARSEKLIAKWSGADK